jgi:type IV pilus assembly protein PilB
MYDNKALYAALKELQVIDQKLLDEALVASQNQKIPLGSILLDKNLISEIDLSKLISQVLGIPFVDLSKIIIPQNILTIIPEVIARQQQIIAFKKDKQGLHIAMENPKNGQMIHFLQNRLGLPLVIYFASRRDIEGTLTLYLQDIGKAFQDLMQKSLQPVKGQSVEPPIVKIIETMITYAYHNNASDIHVEPEEAIALVRFRIDGILHDIIQFPIAIYPDMVRRIKVLARLRTDETHEPQDGKIEFSIDDNRLDIRVSTAPIKKGEKIVMRLLSERARQISLLTLGFSQGDLIKVEESYKKPYGTILSTGPTGSGKTTTMYAILKLLNNRDVNIMTIEDPIEYDIEGVNQMQVNPKANITFAAGLRSLLRQDPNIILVGEIRDEETAGIAINAAMTGHLVLSTLHTNDAATSIPRLFDMGIEPFLIASTVNAIIAQRLVRKIHTVCRVSNEVPREELLKHLGEFLVQKIFGQQKIVRLYKGKGCALCHNSAYEGRIGIFEVMILDDAIKQAISSKSDVTTIRNLAQKNGMKTMLEDGLEKVKTGETTIEEILRVTKE